MSIPWSKRLGVVGRYLVAVLMVLTVVGGLLYWHSSHVETILARIRSAGEPVTVAELAAMSSTVPPEQDATQLWLDGFAANGPTDQARFAKLPFVRERRPDETPLPGSDWSELPLAEEYLAERAEALRRFHEAAQLGGAARLNPAQNPMTVDTESPREAVRLLLLESLVRAHKGEVGPTVASLKTAFAVGKANEGCPNQISFLVRQAVDASATAQLLRLLPRAPFSDEQLARLQAMLQTIDHGRALLHALLGERVNGIRVLRKPALLAGSPLGAGEAFVFTMFGNVAIPNYLERMSDAVSAAKLPWPEALDGAKQFDKLVAATPWYAAIGRILTPALEATFIAAARGMARIRLADTALAAQRYRLANGRLPETLDDLVPAFLPSIPLDPFTGEPLHYRPTDDGFVVYSVGEDGKDDGGPLEDFQTEKPDLGYRIRYPKEVSDAGTE